MKSLGGNHHPTPFISYFFLPSIMIINHHSHNNINIMYKNNSKYDQNVSRYLHSLKMNDMYEVQYKSFFFKGVIYTVGKLLQYILK